MTEQTTRGFISWGSFEKIGTVPPADAHVYPGDPQRIRLYPELDITASPEGFIAIDGPKDAFSGQWNNGKSVSLSRRRSGYVYHEGGFQTTVVPHRFEHVDTTTSDPGRLSRQAKIRPHEQLFTMEVTGGVPIDPELRVLTSFYDTAGNTGASIRVETDQHKRKLDITLNDEGIPTDARLYSPSFLHDIGATIIDKVLVTGDERAYLDDSACEPQVAFTALAAYLGYEGASGIDVRQSAIDTYSQMSEIGFNPMSALAFR